MINRQLSRLAALAALCVCVFFVPAIHGQNKPAAAPTPRDLAPIDLTGYWVSVVTEDWRYRMVMPQKGDFGSVPLNSEGRRVAERWTTEQAGGCAAYGVAAGLRMPGRIHITWENDSTLRIDTEAGAQTRRLYLGTPPAAGAPSWQGVSKASWDGPPDVIDVLRTGGFDQLNRGTGQAARRLAWTPLKVVTTNFKAGWLRANGVPYSADAAITEHFMRYAVPDGGEWLTVRTVVDDPLYLVQPFMTSTNFKRLAPPEGGPHVQWSPKACRE
jgi:hypothetical protein